jgi:hypothetical protein
MIVLDGAECGRDPGLVHGCHSFFLMWRGCFVVSCIAGACERL